MNASITSLRRLGFRTHVFPGLRIRLMVVPRALAESFTRANAEKYRDGRGFLYAVLIDFIGAGHFSSHVRRMLQLYAARREALPMAICTHWGAG